MNYKVGDLVDISEIFAWDSLEKENITFPRQTYSIIVELGPLSKTSGNLRLISFCSVLYDNKLWIVLNADLKAVNVQAR